MLMLLHVCWMKRAFDVCRLLMLVDVEYVSASVSAHWGQEIDQCRFKCCLKQHQLTRSGHSGAADPAGNKTLTFST